MLGALAAILLGSYDVAGDEWERPLFPKRGNELASLKSEYPVEMNPVIALIWMYAFEYKVNPNLAILLAKTESNFNPMAKNPESTAGGVYQWINSSWATFCEGNKFDAEDNIKCTMRVLSEGGLSSWLADKNTEGVLLENCLITKNDQGIFAQCL